MSYYNVFSVKVHNYLLDNLSPWENFEYELVVTDSTDKAHEAVKEGKALIILDSPALQGEAFPRAQCFIQDLCSCEDQDFLEKMCQRKHSLPWKIAEDEEIYLRELSLQDLSLVPEKLRPSMEKAESYINTMYYIWGFGIWLIVRKSDGAVIGRAGLGTREDEGEDLCYDLGYEILEPYRRKGYGRRAAGLVIEYAKKELFLERLALYVSEENIASINLARSLGFSLVDEMEKELYFTLDLRIGDL